MKHGSTIKCAGSSSASGQGFTEEEIAFLADPTSDIQNILIVITHNAAYQADDLDALTLIVMNSTSARLVMANLSREWLRLASLRFVKERTTATAITDTGARGGFENTKDGENFDLNAKLQEQGLVIAALKNELRKLKGKAVDKEAIETHSVDPNVSKDNMEPITPKLLNKRTAHSSYIKHTQEEALVLRDIVEHNSKKQDNSDYVCINSDDCMSSDNLCVSNSMNDVKFHAKPKKSKSKKDIWKPTGKVFTQIGYIWRPTGRTFTIVGNACPLTRITTTNEVPSRKPIVLESESPKHVVKLVYSRKPIKNKNTESVSKTKVVQIVLWYLDSGCSKHMTGDRSQLTNFISKFLGTVKFGNDQVAKIMVAFRQHTCFIRNLEGVDLLTGSRGDNLYTLSLGNMMASSPICLLSKASKTKSWLWHRRLSHLNFGAINHLARHGLVRGLPKLKFEKDHLCSACALGKSSKKPHKPKSEDTNQEKLYLLHMDLCGPMRVASVNGKKYILVIVDDYSRFTWVKCLRSKDEAPAFIINFLKMIQVRLKETVRRIRTDNGTEFVNQTLREYYEKVGISHETSVARSPQQNGVVERRNRTLIEAARTMLIYAKAPLFLWAEAVATACYTQNRSMIRRRHGKTPYELLHDKPPDLSYLHVFGALCYPTNDCENLGKLQPKADIGIFIGYAPTKKAFRIYNRRTRRIIETIHVDFDELTAMASEHSSSGPALHEMTPVTISSGLVPNPPSSTPFVPPSRSDWDLLFQPMFDESLNPPPYVDLQVPEVIAPIPEVVAHEHAVSTGSPSSTIVNQDAPSPSNSHTTQETQTPIISHDVEEDNHDIEVAHMGNDPYFGIPIPEVPSDQSSSSDVIHTIVPSDHQVSEHNRKWTKDHPLENIIGDLGRPVSTRLQIHEYYHMGRMILASVDKDHLFAFNTEDGVTRLKEYVELTPEHHKPKQERECKLYDEFDKFTYKRGETLHEYYLRFAHYPTLNQLHAHLQQHERHAIEVRLMHERNPDPLALVASHQLTQPAYQSHLHHHPQSLSQHQISPYQTSQFVTPYQHQSTPLSTTYPTNEYQSTVHHNVYSQQPSIPQLEYAPTTYQQQQPEFSQSDSNLVVPVFQKGDDPIDAINHMMSFLTAVVTSRYPTTNNQLRTSSNPRQQATIYDGKVTVQPVQGRHTSYAAGTTRKYTSGASGSNTGKPRTVHNDKVLLVQAQAGGQALTEEEIAFLADPGLPDPKLLSWPSSQEWIDDYPLRYKEEVKELKEKQNVENSFSGSNEQFAEIAHLKQNLFEQGQEKDSLMKTVSELKNKLQLEENRNIEREIELEKKIKQLDNIIFKRGQSAQTVRMLTNSKRGYDHSSKQAIETSVPPLDPSHSSTTVIVEVPKELPTVSMVNTSLKELKRYLTGFDQVVKERTTATAITEGTWGVGDVQTKSFIRWTGCRTLAWRPELSKLK
ncbi:retrovirus-related pol polyprotein from transposon TNT 1-94 [Tanacetum coccineum]